MIIMKLLKIVFTILICLPVMYLMIYLLTKLIDEVLSQNPKKKVRSKKKTRDGGTYR